MAEVCEGCTCALSDDEADLEEATLTPDMSFEEFVRDYLLDELDLDDESTYLQRVTICPGETMVEYQDKS